MRPLRLYLKGFTVYRKPQELDFRPLSFFSVQGPTGAGKTSIVDAITFALYGKVARYGKRDAKKLVLSRGEKELKVVLEFSVKDRRYRVERFYRAPSDQYEVRVYEEDRPLDLKKPQVEKWVERVTGLDFTTFTKVVLLPQGQFDRFLKDASERRSILVGLLGLEALEKARELASQRHQLALQRKELLQRELKELSPFNEQLLNKLKDELGAARRRAEELRRLLAELENELLLAEKRRELEEKLKQIDRELEKLRQLGPEFDELKKKLELSERVAPFVPAARRLVELTRLEAEERLKREKLLKEIELLRENLRQAEAALSRAREEEAGLVALREEVRKIKQKLEELRLAGQLKAELDRLGRQISALESEFSRLEQKRRELDARIKKGSALISQTRKQLEELEALYSEDELMQLQRKAVLKEELARLVEELRRLEEERRELVQALKRESGRLERVRRELKELELKLGRLELSYHVYEAAKHLREGDPCPLCGGSYKGHPLVPPPDELTELKSRYEELNKEVLELEGRISLIKSRLKELDERYAELNGRREELERVLPPNLEERLNELTRLRDEIKKLRKTYERYTARLQELLTEREGLQRELEELQRRLSTLKGAYEEKKARLEELPSSDESELLAQLRRLEEREREVLELRRRAEEHLREVTALLSAREGAYEELERKLKAVEQERKELTRELGKLYPLVKSPEEVLGLYLGEEEARLRARLDEYEEKLRLAERRREELLQELKRVPPCRPYEELRAKAEELKAALEEEVRRAGALETELNRAQEAVKRKGELEKELKEAEKEERLYGILKGDLRADAFQRFVADIMLARVVERAAYYFNKFTGSLSLELRGDAEKEIVVVDALKGLERPVSSLSGGETFLASLALAFGVSEVLSGKANLESLFIDEGFGSLDEEMRDRVSELLETVKTHVSKLVGVITHVPDVAERFSQRVLVEKKGDHSVIRVVT
ncbi:MAG: hypothetical protein GXO03_04785 [Aquificae bacterium]|nr:hypothetical protein [Aquificota bacterium]